MNKANFNQILKDLQKKLETAKKEEETAKKETTKAKKEAETAKQEAKTANQEAETAKKMNKLVKVLQKKLEPAKKTWFEPRLPRRLARYPLPHALPHSTLRASALSRCTYPEDAA